MNDATTFTPYNVQSKLAQVVERALELSSYSSVTDSQVEALKVAVLALEAISKN